MVVLNVASSSFIDLNRSATELWEVLIAAGWHEQDAILHLRNAYSMEIGEATNVVGTFISELVRVGVLTPVDA